MKKRKECAAPPPTPVVTSPCSSRSRVCRRRCSAGTQSHSLVFRSFTFSLKAAGRESGDTREAARVAAPSVSGCDCVCLVDQACCVNFFFFFLRKLHCAFSKSSKEPKKSSRLNSRFAVRLGGENDLYSGRPHKSNRTGRRFHNRHLLDGILFIREIPEWRNGFENHHRTLSP